MNERRPELFDTALLARRRARAEQAGFAEFLYREVAAQTAERLSEVKREFRRVALIGSAAEVIAAAIPAGAEVTAVNPSTDMSDETLPLEPGTQDLAISALLMHHLNDPVGHLIQLRRALRPDGLLLATLFGGATLTELRASLAEAEAEVEGGLSPRISPMGEIRDLGALLQRAEFAMPVADAERFDVTYASALDLMRELRAMGETNIQAARRREPMRRTTLARACEIYAQHFGMPEGRVRATFEVIFLTGWAPDPDQPQPLRPGSAKARLADALGAEEISAGEKAGDEG